MTAKRWKRKQSSCPPHVLPRGGGTGAFVFVVPIQHLAYADSHHVAVIIGSAQWGLWMKCLLAWLLLIDEPPIPKLPVLSPSPSSIDIPMDCKSVESRTSWTTPPIAAGGRASPTAKLAIVTLRRMHRHTEEGAIQKAIGLQGNRRTRNFPLLFQLPPSAPPELGKLWTGIESIPYSHPSPLGGLEIRYN